MRWQSIFPATSLMALLMAAGAQTGGVFAQDASSSAVVTQAIAQPQLSSAAQQLLSIAESGASEDLQIAFVNSQRQAFTLSTDALFYLRDQGVSPKVIDAIMEHDRALAAAGSTATYTYDQRAYPPAPVPQPTQTVDTSSPQPTDTTYVTDAPPEVNHFYDSLQPYGTWINLNGAGWCWQPRAVAVDPAWRPYSNGGHWIYSEAGWFWQSDYSWGWAPFHYGRWQLQPGVGWVWFPDTTWGPGWVCWRHGLDSCGWAPLPRHVDFVEGFGCRYNGVTVGINYDFGLGVDAFTFVALANFGARDYSRYRFNHEDSHRAFQNTIVINNYGFGKDHVVLNRGLDKGRVEAVTHQQFQIAQIRAEHSPADHSVPGAVVVYHHELPRQAPAMPVRGQLVDSSHPVVVHQPIGIPNAGTYRPATPQTSPSRPANGNPGRPAQPNSPGTPRASVGSPPANSTGAVHYQSAPAAQTTAPQRTFPVHYNNYPATASQSSANYQQVAPQPMLPNTPVAPAASAQVAAPGRLQQPQTVARPQQPQPRSNSGNSQGHNNTNSSGGH